jgi:hypothetical protein
VTINHRVVRVLNFSPVVGIRTPSPADDMPPLIWLGGGDTHSLAGEGVGGPHSDEVTKAVVLNLLSLLCAIITY